MMALISERFMAILLGKRHNLILADKAVMVKVIARPAAARPLSTAAAGGFAAVCHRRVGPPRRRRPAHRGVAEGGRSDRTAGFLLGVVAGASCALVDGALNGSMALRMTEIWAGLMILRGAAAATHCLASRLGWQTQPNPNG
jgi:hypothetical protein